eukprot:snap_masked-scaffold_2-processed-gene-27.36-mRNA-1 protein AED:1.00 eAED:1.00 QI:0/-1/0/0/-1/1/1/0/123
MFPKFPSKDILLGYRAHCRGSETTLVHSKKGTTIISVAEQNLLYNKISTEKDLKANIGILEGVKAFIYLPACITTIAKTPRNAHVEIKSAIETPFQWQPILRNNFIVPRMNENIAKAVVVFKI